LVFAIHHRNKNRNFGRILTETNTDTETKIIRSLHSVVLLKFVGNLKKRALLVHNKGFLGVSSNEVRLSRTVHCAALVCFYLHGEVMTMDFENGLKRWMGVSVVVGGVV
jgi:hypothetical protein